LETLSSNEKWLRMLAKLSSSSFSSAVSGTVKAAICWRLLSWKLEDRGEGSDEPDIGEAYSGVSAGSGTQCEVVTRTGELIV
jgi:hypothetical protein